MKVKDNIPRFSVSTDKRESEVEIMLNGEYYRLEHSQWHDEERTKLFAGFDVPRKVTKSECFKYQHNIIMDLNGQQVEYFRTYDHGAWLLVDGIAYRAACVIDGAEFTETNMLDAQFREHIEEY